MAPRSAHRADNDFLLAGEDCAARIISVPVAESQSTPRSSRYAVGDVSMFDS